MTEQEMGVVLATLDNIWGGVDEGRGAGYAAVLGCYDQADVMAVIERMARGELRDADQHKWLPRAPEIAVHVAREVRVRQTLERAHRNLRVLARVEERQALPQHEAAT